MKVDKRFKNPGWKFSQHELEGVPIRLEVGPKDLTNGTARCCRRDTMEKNMISLDNLEDIVNDLMVNIHDTLYARAEQSLYENIVLCRTWEEFLQALSEKKLAICPSANTNEVEENIKQKTKTYFDSADHDVKALSGKAKSLCIPKDQNRWGDISDEVCIESGQPASVWILYGRSY